MSKLTRENAIIHATHAVGLSEYLGCAVGLAVSSTGPETQLYDPVEGNKPDAVLLHADSNTATLAMTSGGLAGTVMVKIVEEVSASHELYAINDGTLIGFADAEEERNSGTFYKCAVALENGVAGEMIEAVLFRPEAFTIA